ncbi:DUF1656 domain-containing protein [Vibrio sp. 10N.286.49.B1]|uniref:DUF1656 domain-containing protein n=1 Tax=unclassified Vibrio TaxID=2614977 RepID=UPI000C8577E0|nr:MULTISPECIES: DUF1656 domain-containing protein [unclassified Vibrio]
MPYSLVSMPHELELGGIYFPPFLLVCVLSYLLTLLTSKIVIYMKWHRFFYAYAVVEVAIATIYALLISQYLLLF